MSINNNDELKYLREKLDIHQFKSGFFNKIISLDISNIDMKSKTNNISEFWKAIVLAHECSVEENSFTVYFFNNKANNPDDVELLNTAKDQGFELIRSEKNNIRTIKIEDKLYSYEVLNIQEFSSERKRMSIIIRDNNSIKLYIKGADCEIKKRLSNKNSLSQIEMTEKYNDIFSQNGYRTLFVGNKVIEENTFQEFKQKLHKANQNLVSKKEKIEEVFDELEQGITLLGATVVEDKLQDMVPETIRDLRMAKIKVWMLTGDKFNTAYNIALSCNLISAHMKVFQIRGEIGESVSNFLNDYVSFINNINNTITAYSILIDSVALTNILSNNLILPSFLGAAKNAESVICCRTSPLQKAEIVKAIKDFSPNSTTLAIGDGGNDVSMILEAHVGKH